MSPPGPEPVVVDSNVFSAELVRSGAVLAEDYRGILKGRAVYISFVTDAEVRFGASLAGWGDVRNRRVELRLAAATVVWSGPELVERYVALRVWCMRNGHGLGQKIHEADRWTAATAMLLNVPLVAHDAVFRDVMGLELITTLPT